METKDRETERERAKKREQEQREQKSTIAARWHLINLTGSQPERQKVSRSVCVLERAHPLGEDWRTPTGKLSGRRKAQRLTDDGCGGETSRRPIAHDFVVRSFVESASATLETSVPARVQRRGPDRKSVA